MHSIRLCVKRVSAPLRISGQGDFSMKQGIIRKHRNDGKHGKQVWLFTVIDEGT